MLPRDANAAIMRLLRERHRDDITSCEMTVGRTSRRVDYMAIACSWSKPLVVAYEVKVDRRDFVQDDKWPAYLPTCKQLNFVTRKGVVQSPDEIPPECGWLELTTNGKRLLTKKKAPARPMAPEDEATLYKRVLMRELGRGYEDPAAFWERWLAKRRADRELGRLVRYEVAATVAEQLRIRDREHAELAKACERMEAVRKTLRELGLDPEKLDAMPAFAMDRAVRREVAAAGADQILAAVDRVEELAKGCDRALELLKGSGANLRRLVTEARPPAEE